MSRAVAGAAAPVRLRDRAWLAGVRTALPFTLGFLPYGLVIGAAADQARIDDFLGWSTAWLTYAGVSQLVLIQMLDAGAAPLAILGAILLINLRLVAYAASISTQWRTAPMRWKLLASYLFIDPAYAIATERGQRSSAPVPEAYLRGYYLGAATTLWATWLAFCAAGVLLGSQVADVVPTRTLADLMLISMLVLLCRDLGTRTAALAAAGFAVPALLLPDGSGPTVAAAVACLAVAGLFWRRLK